VLEHVVGGQHGIRLDVLHRELELGRDGVAAEHRHHAAAQPDGECRGEGPPGVVGLDQHRRGPAERLLESRREVARRSHHLTHGVDAERVDDGRVARGAFGSFGEIPH
jgi:hypothetical protein